MPKNQAKKRRCPKGLVDKKSLLQEPTQQQRNAIRVDESWPAMHHGTNRHGALTRRMTSRIHAAIPVGACQQAAQFAALASAAAHTAPATDKHCKAA
jgi:hypothetical protein